MDLSSQIDRSRSGDAFTYPVYHPDVNRGEVRDARRNLDNPLQRFLE